MRGGRPARRPVGRDTVQRLETALAVAADASPRLSSLTRAAARSAAGELAAADALRDVAAGRVASGGSSVDALSAAIDAAKGFPNLQVRILYLRAADGLRWPALCICAFLACGPCRSLGCTRV